MKLAVKPALITAIALALLAGGGLAGCNKTIREASGPPPQQDARSMTPQGS